MGLGMPLRFILKFIVAGMILLTVPGSAVLAASREEMINALASDDRQIMMQAIEALPAMGDKAALEALFALQEKRLARDGAGRAVIVDVQQHGGRYADSGQSFQGDLNSLQMPVINNRIRNMLKTAVAEMSLLAEDRAIRLQAAQELARSPREDSAERIRKALKQENDSAVRKALTLALALTEINSPHKQTRIQAIAQLGRSGNSQFIPLLEPILSKGKDGQFTENDDDIRQAAQDAMSAIERRGGMVRSVQDMFYGISLGSVLLLTALGLAITFGLMGVINMAHGEMLMLGAYATYVTQKIFRAYLPEAINWYLPAAVPIAFAISCLVGIFLERCVIRFLYGRPLETLLATW
jgi:urea transport system permease protein